MWGCLQTNRVYAARYRHLTTRETQPAQPTQAQTAVAGAILRQLHYVIAHQQAWDPAVAAHGTRSLEVLRHNRYATPRPHADTPPRAGAGRAFRGIENPCGISSDITGRPCPVVDRNRSDAAEHKLDHRYAGTDDRRWHPPSP